MKIYLLKKNNFSALAIAYNRGQAVKLLAKELEQRGLTLEKEDPVTEIDVEQEKKGKVVLISD